MTTTGILVSVLALLLGAGAGWLLGRMLSTRTAAAQASQEHERALADARLDASTARSEASRAREDLSAVRLELAQRQASQAELRTASVEAQREVAVAQAATSRAQAELSRAQAERDAALSLVEELKSDREKLVNQFKVLSEESLERQGAKQDKTAQERLAATQQMVTPLTEGLRQLNERLSQVEKERAHMAAELGEQIRSVLTSGETIRREASVLSNALRKPQVRGSWGEQSLRRIAEISGMAARCDFDDQQTYTAADGERFRPDMRVNLPQDRIVFVDSKVPLSAVLDAYSCEDDELQKQHLQTFARHVRTHIEQLSSKDYWCLDVRSPEFVILFLGSDEFLRLALEQMPDLHEFAVRHNVALASPGLLIPMLRSISHSWKQSELAESAAEVIGMARELHKRLSTLGGHVDKLGRSLTSSVKAYNQAVSSIESRVMVQARKFQDMGVVEQELGQLSTIDEPVREHAVPEMLEYDEQLQELALLDRVRPVTRAIGE